MGQWVWDGSKLLPRAQARIDIEDRGYTFGDGIYEVFRVYNGTLFEPDAHWRRFKRSAGELRLPAPCSGEHLARGIEQLVQADRLMDGIVYVQMTRGAAPRQHQFPDADTPPVLTAFTKPLERPADALANGARAITHPDIRWLRCDIKSLNLLPNVLAKQAAAEAGAIEAILHRDGRVTEGSASNAAIVRDGVVLTHPADHLILDGITRSVALRLAGRLGLEVREQPYTVEQLLKADEAFLLSTTLEILPVVCIDDKPVGVDGRPGPVTRRLQQAFAALLEIPDHKFER